MDGLALLCTLHADGPLTLKRLRSVGCSDLEAFLARPTEEVARLLDVTPAHARRLRREADLLRERVGVDLLQEEESGPMAPAGEDEPSATASPGSLSNLDRAILGRVIEQWRERDAQESVPRAEAEDAPPSSEPALGLALVPEIVTGLTPEHIVALATLEIATLPMLAEADPAWIAAELALPFSEVRRLQFLARRVILAVAAASPPEPAPAAGESNDVSEPPAPIASRSRSEQPFGAGIESGERRAPLWNFEIPRPVPEPAAEHETSGGPFA